MSVDYGVTDVFAEKGKLVLTDGKLSTKYEKGGHVDTMLNALYADQEFFAAEMGLAQARRDKLLSLVQLYKGIRRWVAVKSSTDTRWPK